MGVLWALDPAAPAPRVGYAVGRRVGPAVVRNRLRRRLRAIVAQDPPPPGSYLITVAPAGATSSFGELQSLITRLFAQIRSQPPRRG